MCLLVNFNPGLFDVCLRTELMSHMFSFRRYCQMVFQSVSALPVLRENSSCPAFFLTLDTVFHISHFGRYVLVIPVVWSSLFVCVCVCVCVCEIVLMFPSSSNSHTLWNNKCKTPFTMTDSKSKKMPPLDILVTEKDRNKLLLLLLAENESTRWQ